MVSEGARPWGRGRSKFAHSVFQICSDLLAVMLIMLAVATPCAMQTKWPNVLIAAESPCD